MDPGPSLKRMVKAEPVKEKGEGWVGGVSPCPPHSQGTVWSPPHEASFVKCTACFQDVAEFLEGVDATGILLDAILKSQTPRITVSQ